MRKILCAVIGAALLGATFGHAQQRPAVDPARVERAIAQIKDIVALLMDRESPVNK